MMQEVEEVWDQIGKRLREAREAADLTVDDVVFLTRIPRSVVHALELEDFSVFTSPTYAKSFLRQYSEYLKVDATLWLDALEPASYVSGEAWQPMFSGGEPLLPMAKRPVRDPRQREQEPISTGNRWSAVWLMLLTVGLVIGMVKGYQFLESKFGQEDTPAKAEAAPPTAISANSTAPSKEMEPQPKDEEAASTPVVNPAEVSHASADIPEQNESKGRPPRAVIVRE